MMWVKYFFGLTLLAMLLYFIIRKKPNTIPSTTAQPTSQALQTILQKASPIGNDYSQIVPYVFAQWQFESANFTSDLYKRAANASGMRIASQRKQERIGETNKYAVYQDWQQCARDLVLWFDARQFPVQIGSLQNYVIECKKRGYFTANETKYYQGVLRYYNENN